MQEMMPPVREREERSQSDINASSSGKPKLRVPEILQAILKKGMSESRSNQADRDGMKKSKVANTIVSGLFNMAQKFKDIKQC